MPLPPGPSPYLAPLVALRFGRARLNLLETFTRTYGDVVYATLPGGVRVAILNHPDYVRDVLVTRHRLFHKGIGLERARLLLGTGLLTSEDDFHARQRRLLLPAFHRDRINAYATTMVEYAERRSAAWSAGSVVDVAQEMALLTLGIAGKTLFDANVDDETSVIRESLSAALQSFNFVLVLPFGDRLVDLPLPSSRRFKRARARLDATVHRLIAERRASGRIGGDVLSMLVHARDVEGDNSAMSDEQVRDEVLTLLLAGHETTANALTWTWYLLSQHPDAEASLHRELDAVLGDRAAVGSDVPQLAYTRAVIAESMRLYPPAYLVGRRALEPYAIPGTDYQLPARTVVLLSQYLLHRDPRFWREPERFMPERWVDGSPLPERYRYAYFPFGGGPRICIGEHFAWMEAILVLATIARRWKLRLVPGHRVELQPIITLRAKRGMPMSMQRRQR